MDTSGFRSSANVEDWRDNPWSYLYRVYAAGGMQQTPSDVLKNVYEGLKHPLTKADPYGAQLPAVGNPGPLGDKLGVNSDYWNNPALANLKQEMPAMLDFQEVAPQLSLGDILKLAIR